MSRERMPQQSGDSLPRMLRPLTEDQRVTMERQWAGAQRLAKVPQKPMDIGLFAGADTQLDLIEMFMDPTNEH